MPRKLASASTARPTGTPNAAPRPAPSSRGGEREGRTRRPAQQAESGCGQTLPRECRTRRHAQARLRKVQAPSATKRRTRRQAQARLRRIDGGHTAEAPLMPPRGRRPRRQAQAPSARNGRTTPQDAAYGDTPPTAARTGQTGQRQAPSATRRRTRRQAQARLRRNDGGRTAEAPLMPPRGRRPRRQAQAPSARNGRTTPQDAAYGDTPPTAARTGQTGQRQAPSATRRCTRRHAQARLRQHGGGRIAEEPLMPPPRYRRRTRPAPRAVAPGDTHRHACARTAEDA